MFRSEAKIMENINSLERLSLRILFTNKKTTHGLNDNEEFLANKIESYKEIELCNIKENFNKAEIEILLTLLKNKKNTYVLGLDDTEATLLKKLEKRNEEFRVMEEKMVIQKAEQFARKYASIIGHENANSIMDLVRLAKSQNPVVVLNVTNSELYDEQKEFQKLLLENAELKNFKSATSKIVGDVILELIEERMAD